MRMCCFENFLWEHYVVSSSRLAGLDALDPLLLQWKYMDWFQIRHWHLVAVKGETVLNISFMFCILLFIAVIFPSLFLHLRKASTLYVFHRKFTFLLLGTRNPKINSYLLNFRHHKVGYNRLIRLSHHPRFGNCLAALLCLNVRYSKLLPTSQSK